MSCEQSTSSTKSRTTLFRFRAVRHGRPNTTSEVSYLPHRFDLLHVLMNDPWAANTYRAMYVSSNSFCAGGVVLGNGTW